jgi:hypothetical protein
MGNLVDIVGQQARAYIKGMRSTSKVDPKPR